MEQNNFDFWQHHSIHYLETLPPQNTHCAELAVGGFYLALTNWQELQRHPWKKLYR
jgi:nitrogen fixation NifU-like protein